jgi:hypothetical protein
MRTTGHYCKAYSVEQLRQFIRWKEIVKRSDEEPAEVSDDEYMYLHQNFILTRNVFVDENVIYADSAEDWKAFCLGVLRFEPPTCAS